ncbi:MAG: hydroxyacid dehydrogenase [Deltaproteobacteria bacterium]|nr:hydroxyacid dehydrogenase [Deltaproteobacteria bacterium]
MRVLVADTLHPKGLDRMKEGGCDVHCDPSLKDESLLAALDGADWDALVVRSTRVSGAMIGACNLGLIVRAGAGVNTIDVAAASAAGIYVANCPGKNGLAVAELAIGLLVSLDRRIPDAVSQLRAGQWNKKEFSQARGLAGRTLAIVGAGQIGRAVAQRARGLDMEVWGWDISPFAKQALEDMGAHFTDDLMGMLSRADAVSIHLPATPQTTGLANREFFEAMKDGAYFINTSRKELVDEEALLWALETKDMRAGIDVFEGEVSGGTGQVTSRLLDSAQVWATPHIGASTDQAQEAVADEAARLVLQFNATGSVQSVNLSNGVTSGPQLVVRHRNQVGVLSTVFSELSQEGINIGNTENIVFSGGEACIARISISDGVSAQVLDRIRAAHEGILHVQLSSPGT